MTDSPEQKKTRKRLTDKSLTLNQQQKDLVFGSCLADGTLECDSVNPRVRIEQSGRLEANREYVTHWKKTMGVFCNQDLAIRDHSTTLEGKTHIKKAADTFRHPVFLPYRDAFYRGKPYNKTNKRMPKLEFLRKNLNYQVLADVICQDGSIKSSAAKSIELHLTGYGFRGQARFAIALYEVLGLKAWVVKQGTTANPQNFDNMPVDYSSNEDLNETDPANSTYNIIISGECIQTLHDKVRPLMFEPFRYKIPSLPDARAAARTAANPQTAANWRTFYNKFKSHPLLDE